MIAAGAFEPFYLRIFTIDRAQLRASLIELPYRKLPGLRALLVETRARTRDGDVIAIVAPYAWDNGYEYVYARSLYTLAGRRVVTQKDVAKADWIAEYGPRPRVVSRAGVSPAVEGREASVGGPASAGRRDRLKPVLTQSLLGPAAETAALLLFLIGGFALALIVDRRAAGALLAAESLLLGVALYSAMLMVLPWSRWILILPIVLYAIAIRVNRNPDDIDAQSSIIGPLLTIGTLVLVTGYALFATAAPVWEFDFLVDWGLKARDFFGVRRIDWAFLEAAWYRGSHPDYPPLLPLAFDAVAVVRGSWSDRYLGVFNVAFASGLLLALYRFAEEDLRSKDAAAFVALAMVPLAATPWIGLAEAPFVAYVTVALLLIRKDAITAGAIMLGCAALTKNEGASLIVAVAIALIVARRGREIVKLWPALAIPLPWWLMRAAHHLPTDITSGNVFARVAQHLGDPAVFVALAHYSLGKPLFWIGIAAGIALAFRKLDRFVVTALAVQLLFYIGAYLATPHDVAWHVQWSWERLIAHLTPSLTFAVLTSLLDNRRLL